MSILQQVAFVIVFATVGYFFVSRLRYILSNIRMGRDVPMNDQPGERFKLMLLVAFGQKKMFKNWLVAILHLFVYVAFLITQIELIEIILDGILGEHRLIYQMVSGQSFLEGFYTVVISSIEILSLLALVATFVFLARRNLLKVPRFVKSELNGWPRLDANIILIAEIWLVGCIFLMNGADAALHPGKYHFALSTTLVGPALQGLSEGLLRGLERFGWWGHALGVFGFLVYLPYSKHLHIMFAFPNTYFSRLREKGYMENMEAITREVKSMMDPNSAYTTPATDVSTVPQRFGAKDVPDLTWKNILDAYTCTECGRCTAACPANQTGKLLSPRKIMMDVRDRAEEIGKNKRIHGSDFIDNKSLLGDYITVEELRACTTCNACVEECPVNISPLEIILDMRRYLIMEESNSPEEWNLMFTNIENNGAPWQFSPSDRLKWAESTQS